MNPGWKVFWAAACRGLLTPGCVATWKPPPDYMIEATKRVGERERGRGRVGVFGPKRQKFYYTVITDLKKKVPTVNN